MSATGAVAEACYATAPLAAAFVSPQPDKKKCDNMDFLYSKYNEIDLKASIYSINEL